MNKHTKKAEVNSSSVVVDAKSEQKSKSVDGGDRESDFKLLRQNSASKLHDSTQLVQYELVPRFISPIKLLRRIKGG
jgi:hypothetical protein